MFKKYLYVVKLSEKEYLRNEKGQICAYRLHEAKRKCRFFKGLGVERWNYLSHVLGN